MGIHFTSDLYKEKVPINFDADVLSASIGHVIESCLFRFLLNGLPIYVYDSGRTGKAMALKWAEAP
jgi:hypothetical protein